MILALAVQNTLSVHVQHRPHLQVPSRVQVPRRHQRAISTPDPTVRIATAYQFHPEVFAGPAVALMAAKVLIIITRR